MSLALLNSSAILTGAVVTVDFQAMLPSLSANPTQIPADSGKLTQ